MTWVGSDSHFAILAVLLLVGVAKLLLCWLRRPRHHHVPHRNLRAASARRGPAAGVLAPSMRPAAGAQLSREFWHQAWLAERQRFTHRGSAVRSVETRPLPAVGTSGSTPTAGLQPNSDRNNTRWTEQWAAKKRAKRIARNRTGGNTPASTATRSETRSSKTTTDPRTPVRLGSAAPRSCGPHPAAGVLGRSPVAGPKSPVDAAIPPTGVDRHPTPRPGEIHEGHEGAVVREAAAPTRSAA